MIGKKIDYLKIDYFQYNSRMAAFDDKLMVINIGPDGDNIYAKTFDWNNATRGPLVDTYHISNITDETFHTVVIEVLYDYPGLNANECCYNISFTNSERCEEYYIIKPRYRPTFNRKRLCSSIKVRLALYNEFFENNCEEDNTRIENYLDSLLQ